MKRFFGPMPDGQDAHLYTISCGKLTAVITDCGATLQRLFVPDPQGNIADVVLGFDAPADYIASGEPMDKAGAYAIQGKGMRYIRGINGDFYTVMGLPAGRLYAFLKNHI